MAASASSDRYREWIEMYASDEFGELADWSRELLDEVDGDSVLMEAAFVASSRHELAFWEAAWQRRGRRELRARPRACARGDGATPTRAFTLRERS